MDKPTVEWWPAWHEIIVQGWVPMSGLVSGYQLGVLVLKAVFYQPASTPQVGAGLLAHPHASLATTSYWIQT